MTCAADVLELFGLEADPAPAPPVGTDAQALLERLGEGPLTADELVRVSGIEPALAAAALIELELARRIALEDGVYRGSA